MYPVFHIISKSPWKKKERSSRSQGGQTSSRDHDYSDTIGARVSEPGKIDASLYGERKKKKKNKRKEE